MKIDFEELRDYLMSYFGTALINGNPAAVIELQEVEMASHEELLQIAKKHKIEDLPSFYV